MLVAASLATLPITAVVFGAHALHASLGLRVDPDRLRSWIASAALALIPVLIVLLLR